MPPPDLTTPEGRAAYGRELMGIAKPLRWSGLAMIAVATAGALWVRGQGRALLHDPLGLTFIGLLVLGWVLVGYAVVKRTRHHRRRMAEN